MKIGPVTLSREAAWNDVELLCHLVAEQLDDLTTALHRLGGRCHRNAVAARYKIETRSAP